MRFSLKSFPGILDAGLILDGEEITPHTTMVSIDCSTGQNPTPPEVRLSSACMHPLIPLGTLVFSTQSFQGSYWILGILVSVFSTAKEV